MVSADALGRVGMQQARKWGLGSLNEFRKFFGLKPHATFEDINPVSPHSGSSSLLHCY